jgi:hypothetical protein
MTKKTLRFDVLPLPEATLEQVSAGSDTGTGKGGDIPVTPG